MIDSTLAFGVERLERPFRLFELSLLDERADEHAGVQDAVHRRCGEVGDGGPRVRLSGAQVAAPKRKPGSVRKTRGEPGGIARHAGLRNRAVEQRAARSA